LRFSADRKPLENEAFGKPSHYDNQVISLTEFSIKKRKSKMTGDSVLCRFSNSTSVVWMENSLCIFSAVELPYPIFSGELKTGPESISACNTSTSYLLDRVFRFFRRLHQRRVAGSQTVGINEELSDPIDFL